MTRACSKPHLHANLSSSGWQIEKLSHDILKASSFAVRNFSYNSAWESICDSFKAYGSSNLIDLTSCINYWTFVSIKILEAFAANCVMFKYQNDFNLHLVELKWFIFYKYSHYCFCLVYFQRLFTNHCVTANFATIGSEGFNGITIILHYIATEIFRIFPHRTWTNTDFLSRIWIYRVIELGLNFKLVKVFNDPNWLSM